jgi:anti-anti-sigma factor
MVCEPPDPFRRFDRAIDEDAGDDSGSLRVIRLEGEIDLENSDEIGDRILRALGGPPPCDAALVDCGGVTLLGASAMSMMVRVQRQAEARSIALGWSRLQSLPLHALKVVGLHARLALVN